ncbi:AsmA family protein [Methylotenera sp. 1P/1]|uniref:AsmA family protein n=1 Tax=Methylotenera sp. 1P/1 TaxID=1131551 RepID=UPI00036CC125|nr:AsmA family protein [Methylotenera sp. 1P/1]
MNKYLKIGLIGLGSIVGLMLLLAVYFALTFNPNDYKQQIIDLVKEKKERTLTIEGDIKLSFWPKIGADLGKIAISEHKGSAEFASVNSAKVALAVLPLLKKELVVDTVYVDGAKANIIKYKDGTTNFDDLLSKDEEESTEIKFDVQGVKVTNSAVQYKDESTGASYAINQFNLTSGRIALAEPMDIATDFKVNANQPVVAANVKVKGVFLVDPETKHFKVSGLDTLITGDMFNGKNVEVKASGDVDAKPEKLEFLVDSLKLAAAGNFDGAQQTVELNAPALSILKDQVSTKKITINVTQQKTDANLKLNMVLADMKGSPKALQSSGISGDLNMTQGKRVVTGQFSSPFNGNIDALIFDIPKLVGKLNIQDPSLPNGAIQGTFNLGAHADIKQEKADSTFSLNVAETKLNGNVDVAGFKTPNIKFNVSADKINLNQLLGKASAAPAPASKKSASKQPTDLSALKSLHVDGKLNIGSIIYDPYRVTGLNVGIKADGQKLSLTGLDVKVDDSRIKGNFAISQFNKPLYTFDIDVDQVDLDRYVGASTGDAKPAKTSTESAKPLDLSALKALNADGSIRVGQLKYGKTKASNINIKLNANGEKLSLNPLSAKVDDSQINASLGVTQFSQPAFSFNVNIDKLDADRYITKSEPSAAPKTTQASAETPIDLSALKKFNASGEAKIGWLKIANVKTENVNIGLNAQNGVVNVSPFAANLYQGSMSGALKVDARATPVITFKQAMKNISVGPLLVDAINNDMLAGKGSVDIDVTTQGNTVSALKKALAGNAALNLADGAVKGIDIAGTLRDMKNKLNVLKSKDALASDKTKKTDFSELTATFTIKNGVAHNEDLEMKAPILRLAKGDSKGDIDIGNEKINYLAKPTVVKSLKGQGGADLDQLSGLSIPVKITGTFASPQFGMDFAAIGAAIAKSSLLDKVGGEKGAAVKELLGNENKADALKNILGGSKKSTAPDADKGNAASSTEGAPADAAPAEKPKSLKEQAKEEVLKKLLKF